MRVLSLALAVGITALFNGRGLVAYAEELDLLEVVSTAGSSPQRFVVTRAAFGGELPRVADGATPFRLVEATITADCQRIELSQTHSSVVASTAVLMERGGGCSFVQKALAAQTAGASLLVVGDSVEGAYASSHQTGRPIFDCSVGSATVSRNATNVALYPRVDEHDLPDDDDDDAALAACQARMSCVTNTCVYTGASTHAKTEATETAFQVCCFANTLVRMGVDAQSAALASRVTIPAVFTCYRDTLQLQRLLLRAAVSTKASKSDSSGAASASASVWTLRAFNAEENPWNVSMLITWLLGVGIVVGAAYRSAADERQFSYEKIAMGRAPLSSDTGTLETQYICIGDGQAPSLAPPHQLHNVENDDGNTERVELSTRHALYFVVGSSSILVLLYYGHLALLMNVLFLIATTASMTQVVVLPVLAAVLLDGSRAPALDETVKTSTRERLLWIASISLAATMTIYWFVNRASASIWPLQDLLCISLCIVVIDSIQMPSFKVATALLGTAFLYDIFFVYVSPLVFGSSVMVDVASGNGGIQAAAAAPTGSSSSGSAGSHEKLPMVLTVPLLFSYYGGNALLGLGDLILPGLLVSLCVRFDYCRGYPLSRNYFMVASVSYALGLLLANVMAIALRDVVAGQPALMYIVPLTLGSVAALAISRHELAELWHGPRCLRMEHHYVERPPRRDEVEPFLKKH